MAFFKFRKGGDESASTQRQPESIEAMRRRAKHRLIGAGVLVLIGVIGFPLLFDTQPRPIAVDIPIEIPDRNKAKPLPPMASVAPTPSAKIAAPPPAAPPSAPVVAKAEPQAPKAETPAPAPKPEEKVQAKAEPVAKPASARVEPAKPEVAKAEPKPAPAKSSDDDGAKALALLEGKAASAAQPPAATVNARFVVQVGAFSDATLARETRLKVEKSGLKTYTQVAETKDGKLIRVRVGPFGTKDEADKAAAKIKGLDRQLDVRTLTL